MVGPDVTEKLAMLFTKEMLESRLHKVTDAMRNTFLRSEGFEHQGKCS